MAPVSQELEPPANPGRFSPEMRSWIGGAVDRDGHAFNETVANRFRELGWNAECEVMMTVFGADAKLGDIDVLAWRQERGCPVYAIECKRLLFARTVAEIGERLTEYASVAEKGARTPIQKHTDRMEFLKENSTAVAKHIKASCEKHEIRSALITDYLVPMQFSERAKEFVDVVTDFDLIASAFEKSGSNKAA